MKSAEMIEKIIIEVLVSVRDGRLRVGEEIMNVAIAGDIRENVFSALMDTVNRTRRN